MKIVFLTIAIKFDIHKNLKKMRSTASNNWHLIFKLNSTKKKISSEQCNFSNVLAIIEIFALFRTTFRVHLMFIDNILIRKNLCTFKKRSTPM